MPGSADLGPQVESTITALVRDGRYGSRAEVLREGVRLIAERDKRLALLDAALARGLADAEAGRVTPADEVEARLVAKYEAKDEAKDEAMASDA